MNIGVVGCGYVGLVTSVGFASLGHSVVAVEVAEGRREQIERGVPPFHEPGLTERLGEALAAGTFRVSGRLEDVVEADIVFLCVQTPPGADGTLDLQYLAAAAKQLSALFAADSRQRVVVVRSTVVPGTTEEIVAPLFRDQLGTTSVAMNPEFLREGQALSDFLRPDRVVIGTRDEDAARVLTELYSGVETRVVCTTPATAELVKCTSNSLLATLISFSNEIGRIAEAHAGVDVDEVLDILHMDRRLTPVVDGKPVTPAILTYLRAGCGFGGSCLPKDVNALRAHAASLGEHSALLEAVTLVNQSQPARLVTTIDDALGGLVGKRVAVLGVAFKAGTDDLRDSAGLRIVDHLLNRAANVVVYDPLVSREALAGYEQRGVEIASDMREAMEKVDACVVATGDDEFRSLETLGEGSGDLPLIVDGRRILSPELFPPRRFLAVGRAARD